MKKVLCLLLAIVFVFAFTACGGSDQGGTDNGNSDFEWTRTGDFTDENNNYMMIYPSEEEDYKDMWYVSFSSGDDMYGWYISQEGETLHGDLTGEGTDGDPYVVTVSEEGEDGVLVVTEAGDEYHLSPMEVPDAVAILQIDTEGLGEIAYATDGEEPVFDDVYSYSSAQVSILEGESNEYTLAARPDEGFKFVKWTKNDEDFSTEDTIVVEVTENVKYTAVFETE